MLLTARQSYHSLMLCVATYCILTVTFPQIITAVDKTVGWRAMAEEPPHKRNLKDFLAAIGEVALPAHVQATSSRILHRVQDQH